MNFQIPSQEQSEFARLNYGYSLITISETGKWNIALKLVMFGYRAVVYERNSIGCVADYCAGDRPSFAIEIAVVLQRILECLPEGVSPAEINRILPVWRVRPIDMDSCWNNLKELATKMQKEAEVSA